MSSSATAAAWTSAIATFLAVVVAIFGTSWQRRRMRPILGLSETTPPEFGSGVKVVGGPADDDTYIWWLRLPVANTGRTTAEDVQVFALSIRPFEKQPPAREMKWADVGTDRLNLPSGITRLIDVVHVTKTESIHGVARVGLVSGVMPLSEADVGRPDTYLWRDLVAGEYNILVSVSAREARATQYVITIQFANLEDWDQVKHDLERSMVTPNPRRSSSRTLRLSPLV